MRINVPILPTALFLSSGILLGLTNALSPPDHRFQLGRHADAPVVKLPQGTITGRTNTTSGVEAFLGIPYVKPPVRFARPEPVPNGYGDVNATSFGPACSQVSSEAFPTSSEDCLTVNVFRPAHRSSQKLPVVIFHHGGAFINGGSLPYSGDYLLRDAQAAGKPLILVTLNYRLGIYGFTSGQLFSDEVAKGEATFNAGYWDQREAHKWVARHIHAFGGDPAKVTIWGQSAGAFSVGAHLALRDNLDPQKRPFRAAIMNSGSIQLIGTLPPTHPTLSTTYEVLLNYTGCATTTSSKGALACLRSVNASILAEANSKIVSDSARMVALTAVPPVIDGDFIPRSPTTTVRRGKFADVPIWTGTPITVLSGDAGFTRAINVFLPKNTTTPATFQNVTAHLLALYPDNPALGSPYLNAPTKVSQGVTNGTDRYFYNPPDNQYKRVASFVGDASFLAARRFLLQHIRAGGRRSDAWGYNVAQFDLGLPRTVGCSHSFDLPYLFGNTGTAAFGSPGLYEPLAQRMRAAWASFIVDLDPRTAEGLDWPAYHGRRHDDEGEKEEGSAALYQFKGLNNTVIRDDFRAEALAYLTSADGVAALSL
ncbi:hypothetical protein V8E36_006673 [Tilletia maclaganii]